MQIASHLTQPAYAVMLVVLFTVPAAAQDAGACNADARKPGMAILEGTVVNGETNIPLQGVDVAMHWLPAGRTKSEQRRAETGRTGVFRFCDAPAGVPIIVRVASASGERGSRTVQLGEGETASVELSAPTMFAAVSGRIIDYASGQPVSSATIDLGFDALRRITQDDGAFHFERVPPGFYTVNVQHLGYASVSDSIGVDFGARVTVTVKMAPAAIPIEPIEVVVRSQGLEIRGFYDRMDRNIGTFFTRQDIEAMNASRGTDILRRVAGIHLAQRGAFHGLMAFSRGNCPFRFVIDGARLGAPWSMDDMSPQWIEGIEIYKGTSQVPIEFNNASTNVNGACGVIVIWTRNRN